MGQAAESGTNAGTKSGTGSLKALAGKVFERLERDNGRDKKWDKPENLVPPDSAAWDKIQALSRFPILGAPTAWAEGFAKLPGTPLGGFSADRWHTMLRDGDRFLAGWASQAEALGWRDVDAFGCHPTCAAARLELLGLVPLISGGRILAMTADRATIGQAGTAALIYYCTPMPDATLLWKLAS